jgi:hypothetical protein
MSQQGLLDALLKRKVTRKQFLVMAGFAALSLFGVTGIVRQLSLRASTPTTADFETEGATRSGNTSLVADSTASGGSALQFGAVATTGTPSDGLWFQYPDVSSSPKLAFAHFFPPFPMAFSNVAGSDYYENNYLTVAGESGIHATYGGFVRDRPIKYNAPWPTTPEYREHMMRAEIDNARKYKLDGFFCDILGGSGQNWDRVIHLFNAASNHHPGFWVIPMLDADGSLADSGSTTAANQLNTLLSKPCAYKIGNTYIVASYRAESQTTTFWNEVKSRLDTTHGKTVEFWHVFLNKNQGTTYLDKKAMGIWGDGADPGVYNTVSHTWITQAKARGEKAIYPVWAQDVRPKAGWFDEARNTGALRTAWTKCREFDADMIQLTTWNDYSEGSEVNPSKMRGAAPLAINAWEMAKWKTGQTPAILRDAIIVSHRNQLLDADITGAQTRLMVQNTNRNGRSAVRNHVEILTYLPASDTITVNIGSTQFSYTAQAGEFIQTYPAVAGTVRVRTGRGVDLTSPIAIRSSSGNDDRQYCFAYNIAGTAGQGDATPVS